MTDPWKGTLEKHTRNKGSLVPLITALWTVPEILIFDSVEKINQNRGEPAVPGSFWLAFFIPVDVPEERTNEIISILQNAVDCLNGRIWLFENPVSGDKYSFELNGDNTRTGEMAALIQRFTENPVARGPGLPPLRRDHAADAKRDAEWIAEWKNKKVSAPVKNDTRTVFGKHDPASVSLKEKPVSAPERKNPDVAPISNTVIPPLNYDPAPALPGERARFPPLLVIDPAVIREKFGLPQSGADSAEITPDRIPPLFRSEQTKLPADRQNSPEAQYKAHFITPQVVFAYLFDIPVQMATIEGKARFRFAGSRFGILWNHRAHARIMIASGWMIHRLSDPVNNAVETDWILVILLGLWLPGIRKEAEAAARSFFMRPWSKIPLGNLRRELISHGTLQREEIEFVLSDPGYYNTIFRYRFRYGED